MQFTELGQSSQVFQPGGCDVVVLKVQNLEPGEALDGAFQPGVGPLEVQPSKLGQLGETLQPGIRDLGAREIQFQ